MNLYTQIINQGLSSCIYSSIHHLQLSFKLKAYVELLVHRTSKEELEIELAEKRLKNEDAKEKRAKKL